MDLGGDASITGNISFSGGCEADLMNLYQTTYFQFLRTNCGSCHTNGPGIGQFGHSDFTTSYNAFKSMTRASVNRNVVNAAHQPPFTGPQHQPTIDGFAPLWASAEATYATCTGNSIAGNGIASLGKSTTAIIAAAGNPNTFTRITWDLNAETQDAALRGRIPLTFGIEARVATIGGVRQGYEFRNPTVRINTGFTGPYRVTSIRLRINGQTLPNVTTYSSVDFSITTNTDTNVAPGAAYALVVMNPIANTDAFSIEVGDIKNSTGGSVGNPGGGGGGNPTPGLPTSVTLAQLLSNDATLGVFRQSCVGCHSAGNAAGGLDITNATQARQQANDIYARMNNNANPMPTAGLLLFERRELVRIWRDGGAL